MIYRYSQGLITQSMLAATHPLPILVIKQTSAAKSTLMRRWSDKHSRFFTRFFSRAWNIEAIFWVTKPSFIHSRPYLAMMDGCWLTIVEFPSGNERSRMHCHVMVFSVRRSLETQFRWQPAHPITQQTYRQNISPNSRYCWSR